MHVSRRQAAGTRFGVALALMAVLPLLPGWTAPAAEPTQQPGLKAVYDTTEVEVSPPGSDTPGEKTTHGTMTVRLIPGVVAVRIGEAETLYDFPGRRIVWIDHAAREVRESSLYVTAGFRDRELENRRFMERMAAALGQKTDKVDAETELGITEARPAEARLIEQRRGDERVFVLNGREATSFTGADAALAPELVPMLERLYLYQARLHPLVRAALLKEPRLPKRLEFSWRLMQLRTTVTWELRDLAEEPFDPEVAIRGYASRPLEPQGFLALAHRVRSGAAGPAPSADSYRQRARERLEAGRGLEAFMALLEMGFATGESDDALLRRARQQASADERMQAVARSLEVEQRDPKAALAQLERVDAQGLEAGYVLDILRANQYLRLGRQDATRESFLRALTANPYLAGPWVDVGRLYYERYQMSGAWTCWETARALVPGSWLLRDVDALEARLRTTYPSFF